MKAPGPKDPLTERRWFESFPLGEDERGCLSRGNPAGLLGLLLEGQRSFSRSSKASSRR